MAKKKKDKYEALAADFKNETEFEEEAEEEGFDPEELERDHFEEKER